MNRRDVSTWYTGHWAEPRDIIEFKAKKTFALFAEIL